VTDQPHTTPEKLTVKFSKPAEKAVDEIMRIGGFASRQEAIRRALSTELFIQRKRHEGCVVLIMNRDGSYRELVWPESARS
jgi:metal-responsive CopG/Arc/MetJ family transcriptional regulator